MTARERAGGTFRRNDSLGLGPGQLFGGRKDVLLHQRGRFAEVCDSDRAAGTVVRAGGGDHPGVHRQLVGQVGEQRQRANIVGRHSVRGGDQAGGRLSDGGVVAIADVVRFDAAGQERGGRGRVGERQSAVDPLGRIGQRFGVRSQGLQPVLAGRKPSFDAVTPTASSAAIRTTATNAIRPGVDPRKSTTGRSDSSGSTSRDSSSVCVCWPASSPLCTRHHLVAGWARTRGTGLDPTPDGSHGNPSETCCGGGCWTQYPARTGTLPLLRPLPANGLSTSSVGLPSSSPADA